MFCFYFIRTFAPLFSLQTLQILLKGGARIFLAPGRRVRYATDTSAFMLGLKNFRTANFYCKNYKAMLYWQDMKNFVEQIPITVRILCDQDEFGINCAVDKHPKISVEIRT